jgi:hypothetical protein
MTPGYLIKKYPQLLLDRQSFIDWKTPLQQKMLIIDIQLIQEKFFSCLLHSFSAQDCSWAHHPKKNKTYKKDRSRKLGSTLHGCLLSHFSTIDVY